MFPLYHEDLYPDYTSNIIDVIEPIDNQTLTFDQTTSKINTSQPISDACAFSTLDQPSVRAAFIFAYLFVFGCCCGGNFLLLIVVGVHPAMRTVTNFFLANLAAADLLVALFCVVQNLMHLFVFEQALWPLGAFMCKMYVFVMHTIPCTSAGLLLVLSVERYIAIMHPIAARRLLTKGRLAVTTGVIWAISVATNIPYYMAADYREYTEMINVTTINGNGSEYLMIKKPGAETLAWCGRAHRGIDQKIMFTFSFVVWYLLPFMAMVVIYSVIGVALWRSTGSDSIALTSSSSSGHQNSSNGRAKRRSQGETSTAFVSRQMSTATTSSNATVRFDSPKNEKETEMVSLNQSPAADKDEVWRKRSEDDVNRPNRRNLTVNKMANGRPHQNVGSGSDAREAVESRKRVIRLLVSIILAFAILTLPNHMRLLSNAWSPPRRRCNHGFEALVQPLSYLFLFSNSGINPILYAFMSKKFRKAVREMFNRKALREQRRERFLTSIRSSATSDVYTTTEYC